MDEVDQIREKIDIVSFIQEFLSLKKAGRNFKANCPFHNEKTPSFMVNPERQRWHCFGCGKGGDVYSFLIEYERLEFPEALRLLSKRTGIELKRHPAQIGQNSKKEKIYEINNLAREFYHYILTKHNAGKKAQEYLKERGVTPKIIASFMLGFAPGTGNALTKYLTEKKKFTKEDLSDAGLASQWSNRTQDFFRGRLIFPLIDHRNNVVGFSGRVLDKNTTTAKYINTRETLVYHKGDHLYALNITKDSIRKANQVIICEGEFDVISCFQAGITNVVGVKGTALTENQVNLLSRFASKITFAFDGDNPGQEAIKRSLSVVEKKGIIPTVITIPDGLDPDEALRLQSSLFKKAVREDSGAYDYLIDQTAKINNPVTADGKIQITSQLLPLIAGIKNEIIKEHYLKKLSKILETSYDSIAKEIGRLSSRQQAVVIKALPKSKRPKEEIMEEYLVSLIFQSDNPKILFEKAMNPLSDFLSQDRAQQKILHYLREYFSQSETFDSKKFAGNLPTELMQAFDTSLLYPLPHFENQKKLLLEIEKIAGKLKIIYIHQKMKQLAREIKIKEQEGLDTESLQELKGTYSILASCLE
jgi:DNA primase